MCPVAKATKEGRPQASMKVCGRGAVLEQHTSPLFLFVIHFLPAIPDGVAEMRVAWKTCSVPSWHRLFGCIDKVAALLSENEQWTQFAPFQLDGPAEGGVRFLYTFTHACMLARCVD